MSPQPPERQREKTTPAGNGLAGRLAAEPTPWLDCDSAGWWGERSDDAEQGEGAIFTECALKGFPLTG